MKWQQVLNLAGHAACCFHLCCQLMNQISAGEATALQPKLAARNETLQQLENTKTLTQSGFQECPRSATRVQIDIWFPEFCKSQCISHFAAPFLNVRTKTSVTESVCCLILQQRKQVQASRQKSNPGEHILFTMPHYPRVLHH
jgi:hypothetical protein